MYEISQFFGRPRPPEHFESWSEVVIPHYDYLVKGNPCPPDVEHLKQWLKSYSRWKAGYDGFLDIERSLELRGRPVAQRTHEYFVALLLQSGQWHAALLLMVNDASQPERDRWLAELDAALAELRKRISHP